MREFEMIHEIINQCPMNHSRDQFLEEIECESPMEYLKGKFHSEADLKIEETVRADGSYSFDVYANGLHHRFLFTEF